MAKVLIVEDNQAALDRITRLLEEEGVEVVSAMTTESAVPVFVEHRETINLIIMDGVLGTRETDELVQLLRDPEMGNFKGTILAVSGLAHVNEKLMKAGADETVNKDEAAARALQLLREKSTEQQGPS